MTISFLFQGKNWQADFSKPLDISIPLQDGDENPNCYYADPVRFETIEQGDFKGSVREGGLVNHKKVTISPHGNGTHTEGYGHLSDNPTATINSLLTKFHFIAQVVSLSPVDIQNGDSMLTKANFEKKHLNLGVQAVVIRTLPNYSSKKTQKHSGTNPPYLEPALTAYLAELGIEHLLVDLPSIDKEVDGGKLLAHKAFWCMNQSIRKNCTITELIYIPDTIQDGVYLLNLQVPPFELDAAPSKPVLYKLIEYLP